MILIVRNETTAALRRIYGTITAVDGVTRVTTKNGGGARKIVNGTDSGSWTNTLTHSGSGEYYVELTQAETVENAGYELRWGYKAADTAEAVVSPARVCASLPVVPLGPTYSAEAVRRIYGVIPAPDGIALATDKAGETARKIVNGTDSGNWTNTLTHSGSGLYYVELTAAEYAALAVGSVVSWGYKAADTAEGIAERLQVLTLLPLTSGDPKRQQILDALEDLLQTITVANGYRTNLGSNVVEWDDTPLDPGLETLRAEYRDEAGGTGYAAVGEHLHTLPVTVRILCQNNTAGSALDTVRKAAADVYQAIYTDVTFGGLAQDTNQDNYREDYGEKADRAAGCEIRYVIEYTTTPGTP